MAANITITVDAKTSDAQEKFQRLFAELVQGLTRSYASGGALGAVLNKIFPAMQAALVVGAIGAIGKQLVDATREGINFADAMGKAAQRMGIGVEALSGLSVAAKLADVSVEDLGRSVAFLSKQVTEADAGNQEAAQRFADLGISLRGANGDLKSADALLSEIADKFAAMPDGITKTRLAQELFERSGRNLIPLLNSGAKGIAELKEEAAKYGLIIGPEFAANAEHFNDNLERLRLIAKGFGLQLANALLPELVKFSELLLDLTNRLAIHRVAVEAILNVYKDFANALAVMNFAATAFSEFQATFSAGLLASKNPITAWNLAAEQFQQRLGELKTRLQEIQNLGRPSEKKEDTQNTTDPLEQRRRLRAQLEEQRKLLDLRISEQQVAIEKYESDKTMYPADKQREINQLLGIQLGLIQKKRQLTSEATFTQGVLTIDEMRALEVKDKGELVKVGAQKTPEGFRENFSDARSGLQNEWGTWAGQMASAFQTVFEGAIHSVSDGITGLIMYTKSWGQALSEIGTSILTSVVNAIVEMGVRWIATQILMHTVGKALQASAVAASAPMAAAASAIWAAPATLAAIATFGAAAAAAPAEVLAAQGAVFASSIPQFADGGRPEVGKLSLVGERVPELFVPDQPGTIIPSNAASGYLMAREQNLSRRSANGGGGGQPVYVHVHFDEGDMRQMIMNKPEADHIIMSAVKRNVAQITPI